LVTCHCSVSVDGYSAGPNQSPDNPLGERGEELHTWFHGEGPPSEADAKVAERILAGYGAYVMGRKMFGGGPGDWDLSWRGWWGDTPPYRNPVFVLTHNERPPLEMAGGTTFHFVTGGVEDALSQARAAAGEKNVSVAGGASTVQQFIAAGLLDELHLHIAPVVLGSGERLLENLGNPAFEQIEVIESPKATHVFYRVGR